MPTIGLKNSQIPGSWAATGHLVSHLTRSGALTDKGNQRRQFLARNPSALYYLERMKGGNTPSIIADSLITPRPSPGAIITNELLGLQEVRGCSKDSPSHLCTRVRENRAPVRWD